MGFKLNLFQKLQAVRQRLSLRNCCRGGAVVVLVLICIMWVRSYWRYELWATSTRTISGGCVAECGTLGVFWDLRDGPLELFFHGQWNKRQLKKPDSAAWFQTYGYFGFQQEANATIFMLPYWFVLACWAGMTRLIFRCTPQRSIKGLCTSCGYNLLGNRTGACPECGAQVVQL